MTELMNVKQTAAYLGVTPDCIRLWKAQGRLRYLKAGRLLRFRKQDVDRFLERNGGGEEEQQQVAS